MSDDVGGGNIAYLLLVPVIPIQKQVYQPVNQGRSRNYIRGVQAGCYN